MKKEKNMSSDEFPAAPFQLSETWGQAFARQLLLDEESDTTYINKDVFEELGLRTEAPKEKWPLKLQMVEE